MTLLSLVPRGRGGQHAPRHRAAPGEGGAPGGGAEAAPHRDVRGRGRGQGQDRDVTRNRAWKEKHKGTRVNHNRRALADKKRKF